LKRDVIIFFNNYFYKEFIRLHLHPYFGCDFDFFEGTLKGN